VSASWEKDEPGAKGAWIELQRLKRRALSRPLKPVFIALLLTAALVGMRARKQRVFSSRVVFRVTENDLDATTAPRPAKALREYVYDVCFSTTRLIELMTLHGLYPAQLKRDPLLAAETMRDDIEVDVWRNYFVDDRTSLDAGRSARLAIGYSSKDPAQALVVAQDLGKLIAEVESKSRIQQTADAAERAAYQLSVARQQLTRMQTRIIAIEYSLRRALPPHDALLRIELEALRKEVPVLERKAKEHQAAATDFKLRASMEKSNLGLSFEMVDPGTVAKPGLSRPRELILFAVLGFLVFLPLAGMYAAAYDKRVFDPEDVRRLGIAPLGHVKAFPGDNVGSLDDRLSRDHGVD
jgi:hypothetical protein